jgi:copper transport protein
VRRGPGIAALAALVLLAAPAGAGAHAVLEGSTPPRGATVARQPAQVELGFDEPVEGSFGAVRVFDGRGERVDRGDAFHPGGDDARLAVHLRSGLARGTYTATFRIVSVDSHIVSGGFVFSVGRPGVAGATVEELLGASGTGKVTSTAFAAARALQYGAIAVGAGTWLFLALVWGPAGAASAAFDARARRLLLGAAAVGAASALAGVALEAAQAAGVSGWSALRPSILREVLGTRFGTVWSIGAGAWLMAGVLAAASSTRVRLALGVPLAYLVALPALGGHATVQDPVAVLLPANLLHVGAMAAWLGGLVCLLAAVPAATRALSSPAERTRLLAAVLVRFSTVALASVVVLALAGLVQAYVEIRHLDLVLDTAFGRAVLIKLGLLLVLIGLGALNRQRTVPRLRRAARDGAAPGGEGLTLRRTLRAEVALIVAVLGVTGALAGYAPATAVQSGPVSRTARIGPQDLQLTVDPARVGVNEVHLYLTDPKTGAEADDAAEIRIAAALPAKDIGAMTVRGSKAGPGHYVVPGVTFGVAGTWRLTVSVRVGEFDEYTARLEVPVR